ncbi:hypothetical protein [Clostridium sp. Marseille-Q7071]
MILTLEETKAFLKVDYDDEDEKRKKLNSRCRLYLKNATVKNIILVIH